MTRCRPGTAVRRAAGALLLAGLLASSAGVRADQLIQIPTADRVPGPRLDYRQGLEEPAAGYGTLLAPVLTAHELMVRYVRQGGQHWIEAGGMYQFLPDGILTPGIAVGIWDVADTTPWGRRAFLVLTKSIRRGQFGWRSPLERVQLTLGTGTGRFGGALAAVRIDLPARVALVAEYDARRFNAGLWWRPLPPLALKAELQNGEPFVGADLQVRL